MRNLLHLTMLLASMKYEVTTAQTDLECGETFFTNSSGFISLPTNPTNSSARVNCTYIVSTNLTSRILLSMISSQLLGLMDSFQDCTIDNITVGCVSSDRETNTIKTYCRSRIYLVFALRSTDAAFSNCRMVKMSIRSSNYTYREVYRIPFSVTAIDDVCGNMSFIGLTGVISSPQFPLPYPHNLDCVFSIDTDRNQTVSLHFLSFHLEGHSGNDWVDSCKHDWLTIHCLSNDSLSTFPSENRKYCGQKTSPLMLRYSDCDSVLLRFVTDSSVTQGGFQLLYTISSSRIRTPGTRDGDCGIMHFTRSLGFIASPQQFDLSNPHAFDCVYSIDTDRTQTVSLRFIYFNLEGSWLGDCDDQWLAIRCLWNESASAISSQSDKYCGRHIPRGELSYSNCDSLTLHFVTKLDSSEATFILRYIKLSSGSTTRALPDNDCGSTHFTGPTGVISSPHFPLSYPHDLNCVYAIDVDPARTILLYFLSFNLEGSSQYLLLTLPDNCAYDWLTISCLPSGSVSGDPSPNIKYCGVKTTPLVLRYSNCDSLRLNFVTDSSITRGGFEIRYAMSASGRQSCDNTLFSDTNGIITSPDFPSLYQQNLSCTYSIDVGRNKSVLLKLAYLELEKPDAAGYCINDWLTITCNETTEANPNYDKKFCGSIQWRSSLRFVDCPSLVLKFSAASSTTNGTGFLIYYNVTENLSTVKDNTELNCGETLFTNSSGLISLPINPTDYLATVNCTYIISINRPSTILLHIFLWRSRQLLQSFQDCNREHITIGCVSEGETELNPKTSIVFCNREIDASYLPPNSLLFDDCRSVKLSIYSMNYDNRETHQVAYMAVGPFEECGNTSFSAQSGIISGPRTAWPYPKLVNCLYTIDGGQVNSVLLSIHHIVGSIYNSNGSCNSDWLTITCLVNGTSVPHPFADRKLCAMPYRFTVRFPGCHLVFLNYSSDRSNFGREFSVRYRLGDYDEECGNTYFDGPTGVVTSPRFPLSYPHNLDCMYSIVGGPNNVISLSFLTFHLEGSSNAYSIDTCYSDWITITCLSDESAAETASSFRRFCGIKSIPLTFKFSNCTVAVLNFVTDSSVSHGGFRLRYTIRDTDSFCGGRLQDQRSGTVSFPRNVTNYGDSFDCYYVISVSESSLIALTIWSISLPSLAGENCQRDWLQISCIDGQRSLDHKVSHRSCDYVNASSDITFSNCAEVEVVFHKDEAAIGKAFRIEYTVTRYVEDGSQSQAISVSTGVPFSRIAECEFGCKRTEDGTNCDCTTTHSGDLVVHTQIALSGKPGHSVIIAVVVILVVVVAIGLAALFLCRRHRTKHPSMTLLQAAEEETSQMGLENDTAEAETLFATPRTEDRYTSKYVLLRPLSHYDESSPSENSSQSNKDMQPGV